ncbi:MAG: NUDIX hydrolase [Holdemanella sp.]|nr:NUDIX hydrolase [Holdemanella sp.]
MPAFFKDYKNFLGTGKTNDAGQTLDVFLEEYDPYKYKNPCSTVDVVVFSYKDKPIRDTEWKGLLIQRKNHPSIGYWALPGGFVNLHENLEVSAHRELEEETGVKGLLLEQIKAYGDEKRDPRARVITTAYMAIVKEEDVKVKAGDDAADAHWFKLQISKDGNIYACHYDYEDIHVSCTIEQIVKGNLVQEVKNTILDDQLLCGDHGIIILDAWNRLYDILK